MKLFDVFCKKHNARKDIKIHIVKAHTEENMDESMK